MKTNLCITAMYPLDDNDNISGIFVKEQIDSIEKVSEYQFEIFNLRKYSSFQRYTIAQIKLIRELRKKSYSNIHIHYSIAGLFLLFYKPKSKVIVTFHGSDILLGDGSLKKRIQTLLSKLIARRADKIIVVSEHMRKGLKRFNNKIFTIPCGVDIDFFTFNDCPVESDFYTVIFPSNPNRLEKNFSFFVKIISETQKLVHKEIKVITFDNLSRQQIKVALQTSNCLVLTSISEGSPQVIKEAMACGIPILSNNVGDVKKNIEKLVNSKVVDLDEKQFINALKHILENSAKSVFSRNELVRLKLDSQSIAKEIVNLYD